MRSLHRRLRDSPARRYPSGSSTVSALHDQILIRRGGRPSPSPWLPWGCSCLERHLRDRSGFARTGSVPGFATRSASSLPFPHRLRLLPLPPPSPLPVGGELGSEQRSARRSLDVGSGQVLRASARDGQPLHQRRGHRGLEPAECRHPCHTRGGVGVLQVRTRLVSLPFIGAWWHLASAPCTTRLSAVRSCLMSGDTPVVRLPLTPRSPLPRSSDTDLGTRVVAFGTESFLFVCFLSGRCSESWQKL